MQGVITNVVYVQKAPKLNSERDDGPHVGQRTVDSCTRMEQVRLSMGITDVIYSVLFGVERLGFPARQREVRRLDDPKKKKKKKKEKESNNLLSGPAVPELERIIVPTRHTVLSEVVKGDGCDHRALLDSGCEHLGGLERELARWKESEVGCMRY